MSADTQSRIRWNESELEAVAAQMVALRAKEPHLGDLEAVRQAQAVLPLDRQRDIKTWALMAARLQPRIDAQMALVEAGAPLPTLVTAETATAGDAAQGSLLVAPTEPLVQETSASKVDEVLEASAVESDASPAHTSAEDEPTTPVVLSIAHEVAQDLASMGTPSADLTAGENLEDATPVAKAAPLPAPVASQTLEPPAAQPEAQPMAVAPLLVEASLIAALQSPAVERALVDVFTRSMAQAFTRLAERDKSEPAAEPTHSPSSARVLLAGFAAAQAKAITDALSALCEVRSWKPTQGPQLFETLASICNVAVLPEDVEDEVVSDLRRRKLVVIRHGGSTAKLVERLESVLST